MYKRSATAYFLPTARMKGYRAWGANASSDTPRMFCMILFAVISASASAMGIVHGRGAPLAGFVYVELSPMTKMLLS